MKTSPRCDGKHWVETRIRGKSKDQDPWGNHSRNPGTKRPRIFEDVFGVCGLKIHERIEDEMIYPTHAFNIGALHKHHHREFARRDISLGVSLYPYFRCGYVRNIGEAIRNSPSVLRQIVIFNPEAIRRRFKPGAAFQGMRSGGSQHV